MLLFRKEGISYMAKSTDLAKMFDKDNIQNAFKEALQETADSMVDEITEQAIRAIQEEAVVFLEARKDELIKGLQAEIDATDNYHIKMRNRIYIFLLLASTGFLTQLEKRFSEKIRAQKDK